MAINFPDSPSIGDTYTVGDTTWEYDGTRWSGTVPNTLSANYITEIEGTGEYEVRFYDIDGTLLKIHYVDSGDPATPPDDPDYDSTFLTFVEWNNSYSSITHDIDIGATYDTLNDKGYIFFELNAVSGTSPTFYFNKSDNSTLSLEIRKVSDDSLITSTTISSSGAQSWSPSGLSNFDYYLVSWISTGTGNYYYADGTNRATNYYDSVKKVYFPSDNNTWIGASAFNDFNTLYVVSIPNNITTLKASCFYATYSLEAVVLPDGVTTLEGSIFSLNFGISTVIYPETLTSMASATHQTGYGLRRIILPNSLTSLGTSSQIFSNCRGLLKVSMGNGLSNIQASTFSSCYSIQEVDFTRYTSVPILDSSSLFSGHPTTLKIKVPASLETAWKAATNWATYADYIVGV